MRIFITDMTSIIKPEDFINKNADKLLPQEKDRLFNMENIRRRLEFLIGRLMLKTYLKEDYQTLPNGKIVSKSAYISLSHSGGFVLLALANTPVGIDIEKINKTRAWAKIAHRMGFSNCRTALDFYRAWTAYESDFKLGADTKETMHRYIKYHNCLICVATKKRV